MKGVRQSVIALVLILPALCQTALAQQLEKPKAGVDLRSAPAVDFFVLKAQIKRAFLEAIDAPVLSPSGVESVLSFAELVNYNADKSEADGVRKALERVRVERPHSRESDSATAWLALFEMQDAMQEAVAERLTKANHWASSVRSESSQKIPLRLRTAFRSGTAALDAVRNKEEHDFFRNQLVLTEGLIAAFEGRSKVAAQRAADLIKKGSWTMRSAPTLLAAAALFTNQEKENGAFPAEAAVARLEWAISIAKAYWSRHPSLILADSTILEIASEAKSARFAVRALERLGTAPDKFDLEAVNPFDIAENAMAVGGWAAGRGWLLAAL